MAYEYCGSLVRVPIQCTVISGILCYWKCWTKTLHLFCVLHHACVSLKNQWATSGLYIKLIHFLNIKGMAKVTVNNGKSCFFWKDLWGEDLLENKMPEVSSFAKKKHITFAEGKMQIPLHGLFHLPLSQQAHLQLLQLQEELERVQLSDLPDKWTYIWNSNRFSVSKAYKHMSGHLVLHPVYKWIWRSSCQNKHKVFFWLLIKDRLSTKELLKRKNMTLQDYSCILCQGTRQYWRISGTSVPHMPLCYTMLGLAEHSGWPELGSLPEP